MVNMVLNIFRISDEKNIEEIILGVKKKAEKKYMYKNFEKTVKINKKDYNLKFFFYMNRKENFLIDWYAEISRLFEENNPIYKKVYSGYGILLIYCEDFKYAISFGRANHLLNEYIDPNFGLEMAAKMLDRNSINAQSSKYFSASKNKSLIVYNNGKFSAEPGESVDLINAEISEASGKSSIKELCKKINSKIAFSSGIKVTINLEDLKIEDIVNIIRLIDKIRKEYKDRLNIPKLTFLKPQNELIPNLNEKLSKDILDNENVSISLSMYSIIDSEIILLDNITKYKMTYERKGKEYTNLDIDDIKDFIKENQIDDIQDINLKIYYNDSEKKINILKIIDYTTEVREINAFFCLYDGKWARFNLDYIKKVDESIEEMNNTIVSFDNAYDLSYKELEKFKKEYENDIMKEFSGPAMEMNENKLYREYVYNYKICKENKGTLLDRKKVNQIEVCDIYLNNTLIHTKIGSPGDFNECINQSIKGFEMWNYNKEEVKDKLGIDAVEEVTLLLITNNKKVIEKRNIGGFLSLRFKLNLLDWQNQIADYRVKANIVIAELKD